MEWLRNVLSETHDFVNENLKRAAVEQKKYYDRGLKPRHFSQGDYVWRWYPPTAGAKLALGWIGPYKVIEKITEVTYRIQKTPDSSCIVVHVDHLKRYEGISPPHSWIPVVTPLEESISEEVTPAPVHDELLSEEGSFLADFIPDPSPEVKRSRFGRQIKPRDIYSP